MGNVINITNLAWFKSSYSNNSGNCVEVAALPVGGTAVRDTKDHAAGVILISGSGWTSFVAAIKEAALNG